MMFDLHAHSISDLRPLASGTPYGPSRLGAGVLTILQHLDAIDEDMPDADGILMRLFERGPVGDGGRIENHHVGV